MLLQVRPLLPQGKLFARSGLKMQVVGCGGAAARAIVENGELGKLRRQLVNHRVVAVDLLRLVRLQRNGEVHRQNGERINEQFVFFAADGVFNRLGKLHLRTILRAKEARPLFERFRIDFRSRRDHSGRIPLHAKAVFGKIARLNPCQVVEALACVGPLRQLSVEKLLDYHPISSFSAAPSAPSCAGGLYKGYWRSLSPRRAPRRCCRPIGGRGRARRRCDRCATVG